MSAADGLLLGIDVGGTKIAGVAVDGRSSEILAERRQPVGDAPLEAQVTDLVRALVAGAGGGRLSAIGLAVPGLVDAASGVMRLVMKDGNDSWKRSPSGSAKASRTILVSTKPK